MQPQKKLFIGTHPEYKRKLDVIIQTKLVRPEIQIVDNLNELATQIEKWCEQQQRNGSQRKVFKDMFTIYVSVMALTFLYITLKKS
jgi:hypothetical protein